MDVGIERCRGRVHALASTGLGTLAREGLEGTPCSSWNASQTARPGFQSRVACVGRQSPRIEAYRQNAYATFARQLIGKRE